MTRTFAALVLAVVLAGCSVDRTTREDFDCRAGGPCNNNLDASPPAPRDEGFVVSPDAESDAGFPDAPNSDNNKPRASAQNTTCFTARPCLVLLNGTDGDDDPLTFDIQNVPREGMIRADSIGPDRWIYQSAAGFSGSDSFTFRAFDGIDQSAPATVVVNVVPPPDDWWDANWGRRRRIEIDYNGQTLTDFPILLTLDSSRINFRRTLPGGADVVFVDVATGAPLEREEIAWSLDGEARFWLKIPELRPPPDRTLIDMYYSNVGPAASQPEGDVWSGYESVWHFDGESNDTRGDLPKVEDNVIYTDGMIDLATHLDAKTELALPGASLSSDSLTISFWARRGEVPVGFSALIYGTDTSSGALDGFGPESELHVHLNQASRLALHVNSGTIAAADGTEVTSSLADGDWHHVAAVWSPGSVLIFVDGFEVEDELHTVPPISLAEGVFLGRTAGGAGIFTGDLDEVRLSSEVRTPSWIAAEHQSVDDAGFLQFGAEQDGR